MPNQNKQLFEQMLKMRRKAMGAGNRKKSRISKMPVMLYPLAVERSYGKALTKIFKDFTDLVNSEISKEVLENWIQEYKQDRADIANSNPVARFFAVFKKDAFLEDLTTIISGLKLKSSSLFSSGSPARQLVSNTSINTADFGKRQFLKFSKKVLGVDFIPDEPWEQKAIDSWSQDNYNLITNLADEYIKKINNKVSEGVRFGKSADEIRKDLKKINKNISGYRAKLIARDQTGKLNGELTKRRMEDVGVEKYTWLTAGDERVRPDHRKMSNKICRWDNSNVYSDDGKNWTSRPSSMQGLIPGQDIQCRCTAIPNMDDLYEEIDNQIIKEAA